MLEITLTILGSSTITALLQWLLYFKKHKATTKAVDVGNDTTEIANALLMAKEWRETATHWKNLADTYQAELIKSRTENVTKLAELEKKLMEVTKNLMRANQRIRDLEK